jgi:hypothetical protein
VLVKRFTALHQMLMLVGCCWHMEQPARNHKRCTAELRGGRAVASPSCCCRCRCDGCCCCCCCCAVAHPDLLVHHEAHELLVGADTGQGNVDNGALSVAGKRLQKGGLASTCSSRTAHSKQSSTIATDYCSLLTHQLSWLDRPASSQSEALHKPPQFVTSCRACNWVQTRPFVFY